MQDSKICHKCKVSKDMNDFHYDNKKTNKRKLICKLCQAEYFKQYKDKNPASLRKKWREASKKYYQDDPGNTKKLKKYGLTVSSYNNMHEKQNGACAICKQSLLLVVDHCHESNKVRGLLCNACNLAIGYFRDDVVRIQNAITYLNNSG